ncbi:MAG: hypothetical protein WC699_18420 [Bacteroidales bacterium]|jgi:hypothetical protein
MANNPLQRTGLLKVSDIMKEKEWLGSENKSLTNLVEGNDRLAPYLVINSLNPLNIRTRITTKPYRISSWYDYNHALSEGSTELNGTITGGTMKSMTKGSNESGPGLGLYNNHLKTLTNHLLNCTAGNATAKSSGNDSFLDVWTRFEVTNAVTAGRGNYYVDNSRSYLQIDLSSISSMRVISKAEILLTCLSNTYTPCRMVLVKYEGGTNFVDYPFYPYSQVISDPVLFASGEQTFTLNSAGVAYLNEKFASGDKYLRVGLITYDYDFLQLPFIGDNLVQGADSAFTSQGHWQLNNSQTASFTTEIVGTRTLPVMKVFPGTSERMTLILAGSNYSPAISGGTYYFLTWYYRFGQFPANFDKGDFGAYTRSYISGNELPTTFLHPDNPTGMSPEWQNGYAFTSVATGGDLLINVGGYTYPEDSVNEFAVAQLSIVNPIFLKMLGGKYNNPKLKYYYDGYPGAVSTGSVTGVTSSQATVGGTVTTDGRTAITVSGLCWNITGSPTTSDSKTTNGGTSVATFSSTATGLTLGQVYYIRPYVTTETGTYYGVQTSFTTLGLPTVTTQAAGSVTSSSATLNGNASADGGQSITDRGFVYKIGSDPIITDNKTSASVPTGIGAFTLARTGLPPGTTYYVKAYATNASGTQLSPSSINFTTSAVLPTMSVSAVTNIAATTATFNGAITDFGGAACTDRGFYFRLDAEPTLATFIDCGLGAQSTLGAFSFNYPAGLLKNRTYYVKAYGINSAGTVLSPTSVSFTTLSTLPTLTVQGGTNSVSTSITLNGTVTDDGGHSITDRGFVYKAGSTPIITDNKTSATVPTGSGSFLANITGLIPGTYYEYKSYATNADGTSLAATGGSWITPSSVPTVTHNAATNTTARTTITLNGTVNSDGGSSVTDRGFIYKIGAAPSITDSKTPATVATGTGSFTKGITGLSPGGNYYFNCYATNANGTVLGSPTLIYMPGGPATVSATTAVTSITSNSGTSGGNVTDDGGYTILERGICWATSQNPTDANSKQTASGTTGSFSANLSSLSASTTYYVRAYARNQYATVYGTQVSFATSTAITIPTVTTTSPATSITSTTATVAGNVSADGGGTVTGKGICYNTSGSPTTANSTVASGSGTGAISSNLSSLTGSTTYYCRAYATNSAGTAYGSQVSFTTSASATTPTVTTTSPATSIGSTGATVAGNVSADGGASVTGKGICWNTTGSPTISNSYATSGTGTGSISVAITNLSPGTTYHCRAYATNSQGTSYGTEVDFTTSSPTTPSVTTGFMDPNQSTYNTTPSFSEFYVDGNEVTSDGGSTITERGMCWSTSNSTPSTSDTKITTTAGTGVYDSNIHSRINNATIYYRAYAINAYGTSYGIVRSQWVDFTWIGAQ